MIALVCVDGTWMYPTMNPDEYDRVMGGGHVRRVYERWPTDSQYKEYIRGPVVQGTDCGDIAVRAAASARAKAALPGVTGIFMVGHSRGCACIIEAARMLEPEGIFINYMGFFDGVDMSTTVDGTVVPGNVGIVQHARRDPAGRSRPFWGNCGTIVASASTKYTQSFFYCTHGAVGGVPYPASSEVAGYIWERGELLPTWISAAQDAVGAQAVWTYMWPVIWNYRQQFDQPPAPPPAPPIGIPTPVYGKPVAPLPPTSKPGTPAGPNRYIVVKGDSLSLITGKFWNDVLLWPILYDNNKPVVGSNPNLIQPGQVLTIPDISRYNQAQLNDARNRGRNWR